MSDGPREEQPQLTKKEKTKADKQAEHINRIKRTLVACLIGIGVGIISFYISTLSEKETGLLAFMLMLVGVVIQRHIFRLIGVDTSKLGAKDWLYQGFMTFALWFMSWTILISSMKPPTP